MKMSFAGDGRLEMGYGEWMQMEIKMTLLRSKPALRWSYGGLKGGKS